MPKLMSSGGYNSPLLLAVSIRCIWQGLLLLLAGDVELNPGPPTGRTSVAKGPTAEEQVQTLQAQFSELEGKLKGMESAEEENNTALNNKIDALETKIDEALTESISVLKQDYESQIGELKKVVITNQDEVTSKLDNLEKRLETLLQDKLVNMREDLLEKLGRFSSTSSSRETEVKGELGELKGQLSRLEGKHGTVASQLDDIQEKMYDFEQNKRNNLIFYGVPNEARETTDTLRMKISSLLKLYLNVRRDVPIQKATRIFTGPDVQGTRPVLVTFETFKDREDVLKNSKVLRKSSVTVTEDLSKRTRECRQELRKFMRQVKRTNPERFCQIEYDKLYIDHKIFVWNDITGQVVEQSEAERQLEPLSRAPSAMGARGGLMRGYSMSSPNLAAAATNGSSQDHDIIRDQIKELQRQILLQQTTISEQQRQLAEFQQERRETPAESTRRAQEPGESRRPAQESGERTRPAQESGENSHPAPEGMDLPEITQPPQANGHVSNGEIVRERMVTIEE